MSTSAWRALAVTLLIAGALSGCGTSPTTPGNPQSQDQSGVLTTMGMEPSFTDDGLYQATTQPPLSSARPAAESFGVQAPITPLDYWRTFSHVTTSYAFAFSDTDSTGHPLWAMVTIHRHLLGSFNILHAVAGDSTQADPDNIIHKPTDEMWTRNLLFHRFTPDSAGAGPEWRLVAASGVEVTQNL